jgi:hypothetical protein
MRKDSGRPTGEFEFAWGQMSIPFFVFMTTLRQRWIVLRVWLWHLGTDTDSPLFQSGMVILGPFRHGPGEVVCYADIISDFVKLGFSPC